MSFMPKSTQDLYNYVDKECECGKGGVSGILLYTCVDKKNGEGM